jgi:HemY protein
VSRTALRWLLGGLLAIAAGGVLASLIAHDPGYFLVAWGRYSLETSFWVGLLLLVVIHLCVRGTVRALAWMRRHGVGLGGFMVQRRLRLARARTRSGLLALAHGDLEQARAELARAAPDADEPLVNYLNAARIAEAQDDLPGRDALLDAAARLPDAAREVALLRAELLLGRGDAAQALALLQGLPEGPVAGADAAARALGLVARCHRLLGDAEALAQVLPAVRRRRALSATAIATLEADLLIRRLLGTWPGAADATASPAAGRGVADARHVAQVWKTASREQRARPDVIAAGARAYARAGVPERAEALLREALDAGLQPDLLMEYASLLVDSTRQLGQLRRWRDRHPGDVPLLLALARVAARAGNVVEARAALEDVLARTPSAPAATELGRLLLAGGDAAAAARQFEAALGIDGGPGTGGVVARGPEPASR